MRIVVKGDHELDEEILDQDRDLELTQMAAKAIADLDSDRVTDGAIDFDSSVEFDRSPHGWRQRVWRKLSGVRWHWNNWRSQRGDRQLERAGWPPALVKAVADPFDYACALRSGLVVFFAWAHPCKRGWVHLAGIKGQSGPGVKVATAWTSDSFTFERGIDVRLVDIVWVADAPYGS